MNLNTFKKYARQIPGLLRLKYYKYYRKYIKQRKKFNKNPVGMIKEQFRNKLGYELNLENPITFNEKLQWLKLNWQDDLATTCADKYEVRKYVESKNLGHLLNELYFVYDSIEEVEWDKLPRRFVLKATHGSGMNLVCSDKSEVNWNLEKIPFNYLLRYEYHVFSGEWVYRDIKPRIIVEKYLENNDNGELIDYKIMCFNGNAKCVLICHDRFSKSGLKIDSYDLEWNPLPFERDYPNSGKILPKPPFLEEMIKYAEILAQPFPFVRVDFYEVDGKIYFGELTFFPAGGLGEFKPNHYDVKLGDWIKLPKPSEIQKVTNF